MKTYLSKYKYWILSGAIPFSLLIIAAVPIWKSFVREVLVPEHRNLLAKASGKLLQDGSIVEVVKVQSRDSLQLEIYKTTSDGKATKIDTIEFPGSRNAHFAVSKQASNLALLDVNTDGQLDIVSAFVDSKMTPRLIAFTWNPVSELFDPISEINLRVALNDY